MPRPCACDAPACPLCRLYRTSPRHRAAWYSAGPTAAEPARPRCDHLSEESASGETLRRLGLSVLKTWHACELKHGTHGLICACDATTCAACPDHSAGE